jgi:DNA mismatch endonuclease (patch repair protein)
LPKYRAAIQIHGCFWHKHDCRYFKWPATRAEFWRDKIEGNVVRDQRALYQLKIDGWRVLIIWECAVRKSSNGGLDEMLDEIEQWLNSPSDYLELPDGTPSG